MRSSLPGSCWLLPAALFIVSCDTKAKEELTRRLNETSDKLIECKKENNLLTQEVASLKRQLATAMANPSRVVLTDPEIINLIASMRSAAPAGDTGGLDPAAASKVVSQGARALQQCYERALKKNSALQYQSGVGLTLEVKVMPQGTVEDVGVNPSIDGEMTTCIKTAAMRWKFPTFSGNAVTIEQKITLTPTKT
jgi:hypothetical protein